MVSHSEDVKKISFPGYYLRKYGMYKLGMCYVRVDTESILLVLRLIGHEDKQVQENTVKYLLKPMACHGLIDSQ